jgi:hypothetical protein
MAVKSYHRSVGGPVKLGKLPPRHDPRTLQLGKYLEVSRLPAPPPTVDFASAVRAWPMMRNDTVGDCTCAAAGHMIEQWTTYAEKPYVPDDAAIIDAYAAVTGYDPVSGLNDNGAVILDVLNYWRKKGIARHEILAYAGLEPRNHIELKDAVAIFGNCYIGLALPISAQNQAVWAVPPGGAVGAGAPGSWGGHAVPIVAYDVRGLTVVTWGEPKRMTWVFLDAYCDEAYAVLSTDWISSLTRVAVNHLDLETLKKDLKQLDAGAVELMGV